jgi:hypothetical protein
VTKGVDVSPQRRISLAFGALYLITFATSIPALWLFQPVLDDPQGYIAGGGADNRIYLGALLELILIIANIGTAIVLIPLLKRQNEILTFSYVAARIMECVFLLVGIIAVLAIVSLRQDSPDAGVLAESLAAIKDWTFKLGPGFVVGIGNGLILGYLMYKSGLMPRGLAMLGRSEVRSRPLRASACCSTSTTQAGPYRQSRRSPRSSGNSRLASTRWFWDSSCPPPSSRKKDVPGCILPWSPVELNRRTWRRGQPRGN